MQGFLAFPKCKIYDINIQDTNLCITMKKQITTHKYLLSKRAKIIKFLKSENYCGADIAVVMNLPESSISRILSTEAKYKGLVKKMLK